MAYTIIGYLLAGLLGLLIQATVIRASFPAAAAPDFILILVVFIGRRHRSVGGVCGAFLLGVLADFASGQFIGPNAAGAVVAFFLVGLISTRVFADRTMAVMIITFLCSMAKSITLVAMLIIYLGTGFTSGEVLRLMIIEATLSALVCPLVFRILSFGGRFAQSKAVLGTGSYNWKTEV